MVSLFTLLLLLLRIGFADAFAIRRLAEPGPWEWQQAPPPNYEINTNLRWNCAEEPYPYDTDNSSFFCNCTRPLQLSKDTIQSNILDVWGEGRIEWEHSLVVTGFTHCYNMNHQYKLVSPSSYDANRRIPNRIPTETFDQVDIQAFVASDTFRFVTLMGSPITTQTAQEMTRVVDRKEGMIILYGITVPAHIRALEEQAETISFEYDVFSSLLSTEIVELEQVTIPDHPEFTRVYHREQTISAKHTLVVACNHTKGIGYVESLVPDEGWAMIGYSRKSSTIELRYACGKIELDNGVIRAKATTQYDDHGWRFAGVDSSFVCPKGKVLMGILHHERYGTWYKCGTIHLLRPSLRDTVECETYNLSPWLREGPRGCCVPSGAILVGQRHRRNRSYYRYAHVRIKIPNATRE